jgi:AcrR family transcriptional regulator
MASNRRMGPETAATRTLVMDAVEGVMREEGYAALSSRRVAERAGVTQQAVYYYFQTMDDLLLAAYRRRTQTVLEKIEQALASERPLHAFWRTLSDPFDGALTMEYLALANHNEAIRLETIEFGERIRRLEVDKLTDRIQQNSSGPGDASPFAVVMAITYIAHLLGFEATLGLRGGHKDIRSFVESWLRRLEPAGARASNGA